jgi:hypothetical protein
VAPPTSSALRWAATAGLLALGFGLGAAGWLTDGVVPIAIGGVLVLIGVIFGLGSGLERRVRPGRELAWCPVALGVPFTLAFRGEAARHHAIWVSFEIDWDLRPAPHGFVVDLEIAGPFGATRERFFQSFCQPAYVSGEAIEKSAVSMGFSAPSGTAAPLRAIDVNLHSRSTGAGWRGRLRTHTCFFELALAPGAFVEVRGTIVPSADVAIHHFHAEAFAAPSAT